MPPGRPKKSTTTKKTTQSGARNSKATSAKRATNTQGTPTGQRPPRGYHDPKPGVKEARRKSLIYWLAQWPEGEFPPRGRWNEVLPKDPPPPGWTKNVLDNKNFGINIYKKFSPDELDDIQAKAVNLRIKQMGGKAVAVLEKLYETLSRATRPQPKNS